MFIIACFGYETDKKDHRKLRWPIGGSLVDRSWNETITDGVRIETIGILHGVTTRSGDVGRSDAVDGVVFGGSDEILESK